MKKIGLGMLLLGALVLAGCANKTANNNSGAENKKETAQTEKGKENSGIISSIKDAMDSGKIMECVYTVKNGMGPGKDITSKAYIQGKKHKTFVEMNDKKTVSIFDGETIYMWVEGEKTGTKIKQKCPEEISALTPKEKTGAEVSLDNKISQEEVFKNVMDVKCENAGGVDFSAPSDVEFTDQCEVMKEMTSSVKKYQQ
jgi:major membrane immunogen (membrane-anchored lipoprotein)